MTGNVNLNHEHSHHESQALNHPEMDDLPYLAKPHVSDDEKGNNSQPIGTTDSEDPFPDDSSFQLSELIDFDINDEDDDDDDDDENNQHDDMDLKSDNRNNNERSVPPPTGKPERSATDSFLLIKKSDQTIYQKSLAANWSSLDSLRNGYMSDDGGKKPSSMPLTRSPIKRAKSSDDMHSMQASIVINVGLPKNKITKVNKKKQRKEKQNVEKVYDKNEKSSTSSKSQTKAKSKTKKTKGDNSHKSASVLLEEILYGDKEKPKQRNSRGRENSSTSRKSHNPRHKHNKSTTELLKPNSLNGRSKSTDAITRPKCTNPHQSSSSIKGTEQWRPRIVTRNRSFDGSMSFSVGDRNQNGRKYGSKEERSKMSSSVASLQVTKSSDASINSKNQQSKSRIDPSKSRSIGRSKSFTHWSNHKSTSADRSKGELWRPRVGRNRSFDGSMSLSQFSGTEINGKQEASAKASEQRKMSASMQTTATTKSADTNATGSSKPTATKISSEDKNDESCSLQVYPIDFGFGFSSAAHSPSLRGARKRISPRDEPRDKQPPKAQSCVAAPISTKSSTSPVSGSSSARKKSKSRNEPRENQRPKARSCVAAPIATKSPRSPVSGSSPTRKTSKSLKKQRSHPRLALGSESNPPPPPPIDGTSYNEATSPSNRRTHRKTRRRDGPKRRSASVSAQPRISQATNSSVNGDREASKLTSSTNQGSSNNRNGGGKSNSKIQDCHDTDSTLRPAKRRSSYSVVMNEVGKWKKKQSKEDEERQNELAMLASKTDLLQRSFSTIATGTTSATTKSSSSATVVSTNTSMSGASAVKRMNPELAFELDQYFGQAYVRNLTGRGSRSVKPGSTCVSVGGSTSVGSGKSDKSKAKTLCGASPTTTRKKKKKSALPV